MAQRPHQTLPLGPRLRRRSLDRFRQTRLTFPQASVRELLNCWQSPSHQLRLGSSARRPHRSISRLWLRQLFTYRRMEWKRQPRSLSDVANRARSSLSVPKARGLCHTPSWPVPAPEVMTSRSSVLFGILTRAKVRRIPNKTQRRACHVQATFRLAIKSTNDRLSGCLGPRPRMEKPRAIKAMRSGSCSRYRKPRD
jgi:hypothetical protein